MIIKGVSRRGGLALADYLLRETAAEKAYVIDTRGTLSDDLHTILNTWELEARATTKGVKPLYHLFTRLAPGETLNQSQWFKTLERVEERMKLGDHPRAVVAHELNGYLHVHAVYTRLDYERGTLLNMGNDRYAHHQTAREMEKEFGLRQVSSTPRCDRNGNEKTRSAEHRMAKESGISRKALCDLVKAAWLASKTGRQFEQNLARLGITMTRGEQRDYNVWHNGKRYDPVRLIENVRTAEFRAKMQIDPPCTGEQGRETEQGPVSRKAEHMPAAEARKQFSNDNAAKPPRPPRVRRRKGLTPRLRPKLWYGDPGI